jgi:putative Mn2+ efflux pump MntP
MEAEAQAAQSSVPVSFFVYRGLRKTKKISRETFMIGALSLLSVIAGAAVAYYADRFPTHVEALETSAGVLLIGGLALLGSGLPAII